MDQAHAAQADRSAAALMLASSIADTYFGWQADQQRLALARERRGRAERDGARSPPSACTRSWRRPISCIAPTSRLAAAREQIAALEGSARLRIVALAALVGRSAGEAAADAGEAAAGLVPTGCPTT
jgi:outer membrane protein, multidrug efflux system